MARKKRGEQIINLFQQSNTAERQQWARVNKKGFEFAHDEQLTQKQKDDLISQGMPTFTINRISPVVEMLNFYATANDPRWQAVGREGSDSDLAAVFSDLSAYVWQLSDGSTLYGNAINDSITKSLGYMQVAVDPNMDNGLGEVVLKQPDPFDIYVDPKSRDMLFRDAGWILVHKRLPRVHLKNKFPGYKAKISRADSAEAGDYSATERAMGDKEQKLFLPDDPLSPDMGITAKGELDDLLDYFELYERVNISYINVFYRLLPSPKELKQIKAEVQKKLSDLKKELDVEVIEKDAELQGLVQQGKMLPERYKLEMEKMREAVVKQLQRAEMQLMEEMQQNIGRIENTVISEKEFNIFKKNSKFANRIVEAIQFYDKRLKQTVSVGDTVLYEKVFPETITEYPIIPFHFKWVGTPLPISAVAPLIGKQQEINKTHQIMVHNASLGSSLRWMYYEGSIDVDIWKDYVSSPGAMLPILAGGEPPKEIAPQQLSNAFYQIISEGKDDMEYLAGIYSSMMGDVAKQHDTFRGLMASDEYGTRRIKQWMKRAIEPALVQLGRVVLQYIQTVYKANKRFRIVQPSALQDQKEVEINIPIYNDMGEAIGKSMDITALKADITLVGGSTLPVNRWAYLAELKDLLQLNVVDDIAVLAETDVEHKEDIIKRKSLYAQLANENEQLKNALKDKEGTIETLERQVVQQGIKNKIMQAATELNKQKGDIEVSEQKEFLKTEAQQKLLRGLLKSETETQLKDLALEIKNIKKSLQVTQKKS